MSLRLRIVGCFTGLLAVLVLGAGGALVVNARSNVEAEVTAGAELMGALIDRTLQDSRAGATGPAGDSAVITAIGAIAGLHPVRHVRVTLDGPGLPAVAADRSMPAAADGAPPAWFVRLIAPPARHREWAITTAAGPARVMLSSVASDEIAETWHTLGLLAVVTGLLFIVAVATIHAVIGWALQPLRLLARGLDRLEQQDYQVRLAPGGPAELRHITAKVNALADSLRQAQSRNAALNRTLIAVQDRERQHIAHEIHDELGPCLFAIRVDGQWLRDRAGAAPDAAAVAMRARSILAVADAIHQLSRRLLDRLRPVELEQLPLSAVLDDMVARWRRHQPDIDWQLTLPPATADAIDRLDDSSAETLYRVVQESLMNAARHAAATRVDVAITDQAQPDGDAGIAFRIADDGHGLASDARPGLGLQGMTDRVHGQGGRLTTRSSAAGMVVEGWLPVARALAA